MSSWSHLRQCALQLGQGTGGQHVRRPSLGRAAAGTASGDLEQSRCSPALCHRRPPARCDGDQELVLCIVLITYLVGLVGCMPRVAVPAVRDQDKKIREPRQGAAYPTWKSLTILSEAFRLAFAGAFGPRWCQLASSVVALQITEQGKTLSGWWGASNQLNLLGEQPIMHKTCPKPPAIRTRDADDEKVSFGHPHPPVRPGQAGRPAIPALLLRVMYPKRHLETDSTDHCPLSAKSEAFAPFEEVVACLILERPTPFFPMENLSPLVSQPSHPRGTVSGAMVRGQRQARVQKSELSKSAILDTHGRGLLAMSFVASQSGAFHWPPSGLPQPRRYSCSGQARSWTRGVCIAS